jgi:aspartyl-tRNA(Asn)/glutamyl-tRNA(Gln) amidotransferase subunit C
LTVKLSREEVLHIARLARVGVTDADVYKMMQQLSNIIENFEILREVNTEGVSPTAQSIALENVMREDEIIPSLSPENVLANAPRQEGEFFRVNAVLEE